MASTPNSTPRTAKQKSFSIPARTIPPRGSSRSRGPNNQAVSALRFLYGITLGRPDVVPHVPYGKKPKTVPTVLSRYEVRRLLEVILPLKRFTLEEV